MSKANGKLITCDICGETVFLKTTGDSETDGGYTRWNNFESAPKGWSFSDIKIDGKYGDVCPKCSAIYFSRMNEVIADLRNRSVNNDNTQV